MNKLKIGIDMDGVLCDLLSKWVEEYNQDFEDNLIPEEITLWNWHSLTKDKEGKKLYTYLDDPNLFLELPVMKGSQDVLKDYNESFEFWVVSAAFNPNNIPSKVKWIQQHFPFLDEERLMFVRNKSGFLGDILIDDKPKNIEAFGGSGILFSAPHNLTDNRFVRANNWNDVADYFDQLLFWRVYDERTSNGYYSRLPVHLYH